MEELIEPYLNSFALFLLLTIVIGAVYAIVYIHDIPYEIAKKRNHPHLNAFHVAGWVSLFLMHTIWPILWIWAYWFNEDGSPKGVTEKSKNNKKIIALEKEVSLLKESINTILSNQTENNSNQKLS